MEWLKRAVIDGAIAIAVCFNIIFPRNTIRPTCLGSIQWRQHWGNLFYSAKQIGARTIFIAGVLWGNRWDAVVEVFTKQWIQNVSLSWSVEYTLESCDWTGMEEFCLFRIFYWFPELLWVGRVYFMEIIHFCIA